jgi:hypothetical protein
MSKLAIYIDFSIKYKIIVGNLKLSDVKKLIWKYYLIAAMRDKISILLKKNIYRCIDCNRADWAFFAGINQNFYGVDMCSSGNMDTPCCMKYICLKKPCKFNIKCNNCNEINYVVKHSELEDIGWNHIEGKQNLTFNCFSCNHKNNITLLWNDYCFNSSSIRDFV